MNRKQREKNRLNAGKLRSIRRQRELQDHTCENCGEPGGHWITIKPTSLAGILSGIDDQEGFWTRRIGT
jgi:hypothetical protein